MFFLHLRAKRGKKIERTFLWHVRAQNATKILNEGQNDDSQSELGMPRGSKMRPVDHDESNDEGAAHASESKCLQKLVSLDPHEKRKRGKLKNWPLINSKFVIHTPKLSTL
jgi:hypothetical protein